MRGWAIIVLAVLAGMVWSAEADEAVLQGDKWVEAPAPAEGTAQGELALIRGHLRDGKNRRALKQAKRVIKSYPGDDAAVEEAMNLAGQAQLARRRPWSAYGWYEDQISRFPMGSLLDRALVRQSAIANAFLAGEKRRIWGIFPLGAEGEGLTIHERIAERAPGTKLAAEGMMKVGDHLYRKKRWMEAADTYDRYQQLFDGRYQCRQAEFKAARAVFSGFRGVAYDDTPLVEAQQRFKAFAARYPRTAGAEVASATAEEIEQVKARKDYETGRFYARVRRPEPAAFYYRQVVHLYGQTVWADKSRQALAKMGQSVAAGPARAPAEVEQPAQSPPAAEAPNKGNAE